VFEQGDDWLVKIEDEINSFHGRLLDETVPGETLSFLELLGKETLCKRSACSSMLLFLAIERKVGLVQMERIRRYSNRSDEQWKPVSD